MDKDIQMLQEAYENVLRKPEKLIHLMSLSDLLNHYDSAIKVTSMGDMGLNKEQMKKYLKIGDFVLLRVDSGEELFRLI
jgi:hypothetical protein